MRLATFEVQIRRVKQLIICLFLFSPVTFSQTFDADTAQATVYFKIAQKFESGSGFDSAIFYMEKAGLLVIKSYGEKSLENAVIYNSLGLLYYKGNKLDMAMAYLFKALEIRKELVGEKNSIVAESYNNIGIVNMYKGNYDLALEYYLKAFQVFTTAKGEKYSQVADYYNNIGIVFYYKADYEKTIEYFLKSLEVRKAILGEKDLAVAASYNNVGVVCNNKGEYDRALEYLFKALQIRREVLGEKHTDVADCYNNIGLNFWNKGEYDRALEYYSKTLEIYKELLGEKHTVVAIGYNNIGNAYFSKGENDLALEYYFKALEIRKELLGDKHYDVASSFLCIGNVFWNSREYDQALDYYLNATQIYRIQFGETHPNLSWCFNNIANIYLDKDEYDKALEYYHKALEIGINNLGEKHPEVARIYNNIGTAYSEKEDFEKSLEYNFKSLKIRQEVHGEKHPDVAMSYNNIAANYLDKGDYQKSLEYSQKGVTSILSDFNDTVNIYALPPVKGYSDWSQLYNALFTKARLLGYRYSGFKEISTREKIRLALQHFQACDTLIEKTRKEISGQSDKLALGEKANELYKKTVELLLSGYKINQLLSFDNKPGTSGNLAFYFSEKNKSSVLLEALAGHEAQKFARINDTLLQKEKNLKGEIADYVKKLAETESSDSATINMYRNKLFSLNRNYDGLITIFENEYPDYFNLKYNTKPSTIKDIQNLLDNKTAIISYFTGDSTIDIFVVTKNKRYLEIVPRIRNLYDSIAAFRYSLTNYSPKMQQSYRSLGYELFRQLIPDIKSIDKQIENLCIIPDGPLSTIPFESLLTEKYRGDINSYKDYPYLINKFNVSYSYSATLFDLTFPKNPSATGEIHVSGDWLAFAPVFDTKGGRNQSLSSGAVLMESNDSTTYSTKLSKSGYDRASLDPLYGTEAETESISRLFESKNLKAKVLLRNKATENAIKSGEAENYKILHFATHGFVNSGRPELSCLMMAGDTTGKEDGILYSGEIYNLNLIADLAVLSACETGLGKIQKGEGIIGLTRALLYAGAKNIIVSLWRVADLSTADLMVNFYKNTLSGKDIVSYTEALRNAKLQMISEGKYAHPLYWSPFILIGR